MKLTEADVEQMMWKGLILEAKRNLDEFGVEEREGKEHRDLADDEVYVTHLTGDCPRWAYYQMKYNDESRNSFTSIFKMNLGTIIHRTRFFENAIMEKKLEVGKIRGRIDSFDDKRLIIYDLKTTKADKEKYNNVNPHHAKQVLYYWAMLWKEEGIIANQAFIGYVSFPAERLKAFEVKLPTKVGGIGGSKEEILEMIWREMQEKRAMFTACRQLDSPPPAKWGTWNCSYCDFNQLCIMDTPFFESDEDGEERKSVE